MAFSPFARFRNFTVENLKALLEVYRRIRPGDLATVENARSMIERMFFDPKRYDLARVGRYKFNKKLSFSKRIVGKTLAFTRLYQKGCLQ